MLRRAPPWPPARPGSSRAARRRPRARTGRRRRARPCSSTKRIADSRRLAVPLDRRRLSEAGHALVRQGDVDDVREVGRLPRDDERLRELQTDDSGLDLHGPSLVGRDRHDVGDHVGLLLPLTMPAGMMPRPCSTAVGTAAASSPVPTSAGPTPPPAPPEPWQPRTRARTPLAAIGRPRPRRPARRRRRREDLRLRERERAAAIAPPTRIGRQPRPI